MCPPGVSTWRPAASPAPSYWQEHLGTYCGNARRDSVSSDRKRNTMYILQRRVTDRSIWEHTAERSPRLCVIWYRKEYDISFLLQQIVTKQGHREECYRTLTLCLWVSPMVLCCLWHSDSASVAILFEQRIVVYNWFSSEQRRKFTHYNLNLILIKSLAFLSYTYNLLNCFLTFVLEFVEFLQISGVGIIHSSDRHCRITRLGMLKYIYLLTVTKKLLWFLSP